MPKRSVEYFLQNRNSNRNWTEKNQEKTQKKTQKTKAKLKENQTPNRCDAAQDVQTKEQNRCIEREYPLQSIETIYMYIYYIGTLS